MLELSTENGSRYTLNKFINIENVPLLLAYPTSLLASDLIFNKYDAQSLSTENPEFLIKIAIPLFLATSTTFTISFMSKPIISSSSKSSSKSSQSLLGPYRLLLILSGLFISNAILGSVRTVGLSSVLIASSNIPFVVASFIVDIVSLYTNGKFNLIPSGVLDAQLYLTIFAYVVLYSVKNGLRTINVIDTSVTAIHYLILVISGLILIWNHSKLHISMIFVTLGCIIVLNITKLEIHKLKLKRGSIAITSTISILLEVLSLNTNYFKNWITTIGELLLIVSTVFIDFDEASFETSTQESSDETKIHVNEEELSLFQHLFLHEDTKAIFSFLLLNTSFMFVQFLYSFRSKSLGLLSDSLHMALDCTSLALGLIAGVLAKRPPSKSFPFGLSKIETLAGFANGVLLIGIVASIIVEGIERIINPVTLEKTTELLIVSFLGFVVNIVGILAFNHGHGESSEHSHGHSHSHSHHGSEGSNDNMKGIFLHILADTLGSAGVVLSTILTSVFHSNIFDPIASLFIAVLIFFSAIPLIKSSASSLLLNLDDKKDQVIRDILSQVATTPGVVGYTTPRFWKSPAISTSINIDNQGSSNSIEVPHTHDIHQNDTLLKTHLSDHTHSHSEHTHDHSHSNSHDHSEHTHGHSEEKCGDQKENIQLVGYIHIQYHDGENSTIIKKRIQKIFENHHVTASIQVETETSECWCRNN